MRKPFRLRHWFVRVSKRLSRRGLYSFLEDEYSRIRPGQSVLTIGSGGKVNDSLNGHATHRDFEVTSIDIDPKRNPDVVGDICSYDFGERQFDVIVMSEVLEHVHSPHLAIERIRHILTDGGRLILTVPFLLPIHESPRDYYRYTRHGLEFLLNDFEDVVIRARNTYFQAIDVLYVRLIMAENRRARTAAYFFILFALIKAPLSLTLGRLIPSDGMTTGYTAHARKGMPNGPGTEVMNAS